MTREFAVRIEFRHGEGRCYVSSPDLVGLHLAGPDMVALRNDLEPAIKDLIFFNLHLTIDILRFVPNLDGIVEQYDKIKNSGREESTEVCLVQLKAA
jgi:hypothetical protein